MLRFETIKKKYKHIHLASRRGTAQQAMDYCKKQESRVPDGLILELGTLSKSAQGKRNDLEGAIQAIKGGATMQAVASEFPMAWVHAEKGLRSLQAQVAIKRNPDQEIEVIVLWGQPGTGKSLFAHKKYPNLYIPAKNNTARLSFENYEQQETMFLDEFSGPDCLSLSDLKTVTDRHMCVLPGRNISVAANHSRVVICSNEDPRFWYVGHTYSVTNFWNPFKRRVNVMYQCLTQDEWKLEIVNGEEILDGAIINPKEKFGLVMSRSIPASVKDLLP